MEPSAGESLVTVEGKMKSGRPQVSRTSRGPSRCSTSVIQGPHLPPSDKMPGSFPANPCPNEGEGNGDG